MKRLIDILIVILSLPFVLVLSIFISILIRTTSVGPIIFWSDRIGKDNKLFKMPKFRTMMINTPLVATSELKNEEKHLTKIGSILRKLSLDELPQLYSILTGKMSVVGPRPALFNQYDLIEMRTIKNIDKLKPGITGWSQINGRDLISLEKKIELDDYYKINKSLYLDLKIILMTAVKLFDIKKVKH